MIRYDKQQLAASLPRRPKDSHKGTFGRVLMVAGSEGMAGAAYLAALAAYTVGAGLVKIYTHRSNRIILQELLPEAVMETYSTFQKEEFINNMEWADVLAVGPGIGKTSCTRRLVQTACQYLVDQRKPAVFDADSLTVLGEHRKWLEELSMPAIVTPHPKEMASLCGRSTKEIQEDRAGYVKKLTEAYPVVCLLKGHHTLVGQKDQEIYENHTGNPGMAKAGSGDVLTGVIAGLLAQKMDLWEATVAGAYLHGAGGDKAREEKGTYAMLARDTIAGIGKILKEIEDEKGGKL